MSRYSFPIFSRWTVYVGLALLFATTWHGAFPLDDAYITLHNARSLLAGADAAYGVSPFVGATSAVHLLLMATFGLVVPLPIASIAICALASIAYAIGLDLAIRKTGASGWFVPALTISGLTIGIVPIQLMNGLETGMTMAVVVWMLALDDRSRWFPILLGVAPFVRPELALLGGALLFRIGIEYGIRAAISASLTAIVAALPFLALIWFETGSPIPKTLEAKVSFFAVSGVDPMVRIDWTVNAIVASMLLPLIAGAIGFRRSLWPAAVFAAGIPIAALVVLPGSIDWNNQRYLAPIVPTLIVGIATIAQGAVGRTLVAGLLIWSLGTGSIAFERLQDERAFYRRELVALTAMSRNIPEGSTVLVHDAGMIAWVAPQLRLIDVVGLKTPSSTTWHRRFTKAGCKWGKALDAIGRTAKASYAIVLQEPFWRCVGQNLSDSGWRVQPLQSDSPYQLFKITPPS